MNIYIRNGIPLLPVGKSRDLAKESIIIDIKNNFDLYSYVLVSYWDNKIQFYQSEFEYADLLYLISDLQKKLLYNDLSDQYSEEMIDLCLSELDECHDLDMNNVAHILETCGISYEMIEMEDDVSDECIELLMKLR